MRIQGQNYRTLWELPDAHGIEVIDQRHLPHRFVTAELRDVHDELRARQAELEGLQRDASRLRKDASRLRKDASLLRDEIKRLQAELAGVYGSRIWRLGMGIATAANPLLNVTSRLRQLPRRGRAPPRSRPRSRRRRSGPG